MKRVETVVIDRKDLQLDSKNKKIEDIDFEDLSSMEGIREAALVLFIDSSGKTKLLKNIYGDIGTIKKEGCKWTANKDFTPVQLVAEESAKKICDGTNKEKIISSLYKNGFEQGAQWQKEQMLSPHRVPGQEECSLLA